jgi:hypothetical protein
MTTEEQIDAAVAVVEREAREALAKTDPFYSDGYIASHVVATKLVELGVITHPHLDSKGRYYQEGARKSVEGKAKRLLDAEAAKPNARILRFSSRKGETNPPRLTGVRREFYGPTTAYTTLELYQRASERVAATNAQARADAATMTALLARAAELGLPVPIKNTSQQVTFTAEDFGTLIDRVV